MIVSSRTRIIIYLCICIICAISFKTAGVAQNSKSNCKLNKADRRRVIDSVVQKDEYVSLLIATNAGKNPEMVQYIEQLNGKIIFRDDIVSYIRVKIPIQHVQNISCSGLIEAINIDGGVSYYLSGTNQSKTNSSGLNHVISSPSRDTTSENLYIPSQYIKASHFKSSNPTYDGRGVTIALVDTSIDFLLPEFQSAKMLDGTIVPKLADVVTPIPRVKDHSDDPGRLYSFIKVDVRNRVKSIDKKIIYNEIEYVAPFDGEYNIGILDETFSNAKGDLNRDGNIKGSSNIFTVLYYKDSKLVWVDTDQDRNFADEKPMTDYSVKHDIGIFGKDNPETPIRETVGFTLTIDDPHELIIIQPGYGDHGTSVAGGAFGKSFFGGAINGIAPEAQIVSVPFSAEAHSLIESIIIAVEHPKVDIVSIQVVFVVPLNDGTSVLSVIANRLFDKFDKPIFAAAGNNKGPVNLVFETASSDKVIAVGSYLHQDTARVYYGLSTDNIDNIDHSISYGPRKDGGFKPDILSPTMTLSTYPGFEVDDFPLAPYPLPIGYTISSGTSTATPIAAAGAALLMSGARQSGISFDANRIKWVMISSAKFISHHRANQQGGGLFQIDVAWEMLKSSFKPVTITAIAPVIHTLSENLKVPHSGSGIYEREGWKKGDIGIREIILVRRSGEPNPITYNISWKGNNGVFNCPNQIILPLNKLVKLKITINAFLSGIHSANLIIEDIQTRYPVHWIMNTVIVAQELTHANGYSFNDHGHAEFLDEKSYFINVPPGTLGLKVDVQIEQGRVMPYLMRPSGVFYIVRELYPYWFSAYQNGGKWSRIISNPEPGVWQIVIDNMDLYDKSQITPDKRATFDISVSILGAIVAMDAGHLPNTNMNNKVRVNVTNTHAKFVGGLKNSLAIIDTMNAKITNENMPIVYETDIVAGTSKFSISLENPSDHDADIDLYLYDCTTEKCILRGASIANRGIERLDISYPQPGKWKIVIDPVKLNSTNISYRYQSIIQHPILGDISSINLPSLQESFKTWTDNITINPNVTPVDKELAAIIAVIAEVGKNDDTGVNAPNGKPPSYPSKVVISQFQIVISNGKSQ